MAKRFLQVLSVIAFALTIIAAALCACDCWIASTQEAPGFLFFLLLPSLAGEGRFVSLAATAALPGLALTCPVVSIVLALLVRRGSEGKWRSIALSFVLVSIVCLLLSIVTCYTIFRICSAL